MTSHRNTRHSSPQVIQKRLTNYLVYRTDLHRTNSTDDHKIGVRCSVSTCYKKS